MSAFQVGVSPMTGRQCAPRACHANSSARLSTSFVGRNASLSSNATCFQKIPALNGKAASAGSRRVTAMAAKVTGKISLALEAGKANPAPPVGPALGAQGVNIMQFCKQYNALTVEKIGQVIPVEITVFEDRSFTFILKTPPASFLLKQAAGVSKGSGEPNKTMVGSVTKAQVEEIAKTKLPDLNCTKLESAMRVVEGTAKNMGITVTE